mgnify:CR=1 FL=1
MNCSNHSLVNIRMKIQCNLKKAFQHLNESILDDLMVELVVKLAWHQIDLVQNLLWNAWSHDREHWPVVMSLFLLFG